MFQPQLRMAPLSSNDTPAASPAGASYEDNQIVHHQKHPTAVNRPLQRTVGYTDLSGRTSCATTEVEHCRLRTLA
jgi:hypothetical protein